MVPPPFVIDPFPDGTLIDPGCGIQKGDGTFGDPVTTDIYTRSRRNDPPDERDDERRPQGSRGRRDQRDKEDDRERRRRRG